MFDPGDLFAAIVVENGAVVIEPAAGARPCSRPACLERSSRSYAGSGVEPLVIGRVLCSTVGHASSRSSPRRSPSSGSIARWSAIATRRWCCLPGSASAPGSRSALRAIGELPGATVAVGDGENDVALFAVAGVSVAVANAVDVLKARADVVLTRPNGKGVRRSRRCARRRGPRSADRAQPARRLTRPQFRVSGTRTIEPGSPRSHDAIATSVCLRPTAARRSGSSSRSSGARRWRCRPPGGRRSAR